MPFRAGSRGNVARGMGKTRSKEALPNPLERVIMRCARRGFRGERRDGSEDPAKIRVALDCTNERTMDRCAHFSAEMLCSEAIDRAFRQD